MSDHEGFTAEEATTTEAGWIRGIILDTIASRVGQVPDLHPRLLEGIEVAARHLAARPAEDQRDERLLLVWSEGFAAGAASIAGELGGPYLSHAAYGRALHALGHLGEDPIARAQIITRLVHLWDTGEQAPPEVVDVHGHTHQEGP